ncbi:hypothetical protein [Chryseobacterium sp. 2R14A]|uniref:hypothetical protein n=1 Tax=Chryseobacterium sp. 2R14A TaxID=3380353 RepID=UPI003CEBB575
MQPGTTFSQTIQYQNTNIPWLSIGNISISGNTATIVLFVTDVDSLPGTNYTAKVYFIDENEFPHVHTVNISKVNPISKTKTDKDNYNLVYNRVNNTLTGDTTVNILNNTGGEILTFEALPTLFLSKSSANSFTLEEDPAFPFSTNSELPQSGTKIITRRLKRSDGSVVTSFNITINVLDSNDIKTEPTSLSFTQYRHLSETKDSVLKVINPANEPFTITAPSFINVNPIAGNTGADLTVTTEPSDVLNAEFYTGEIEIAYANKVLKIPVSVNNIDFIDFKIEEHNFCLDNFILSVQKINDAGKFIRISLEMNFETADENFIKTSVYQIAYYNGKATTDVGKKVNNYFPVFSKHIFENPGIEFNNIFVFKPTIVKVKIEELDGNYETVFTKTVENIRLFPGHKPKMFPVFSNSSVKRIYGKSAHLFTYLTTLVDPSEIVGKTVSTNPFANDEVNSAFFNDDEGLTEFGDYKKILGIDFLRIPKGHQQIYYQYINQNLVPELFVFNGDYSIEENYDHTYDDVEFNAKKYDAKVVGRITVNTGFIFKEESETLSELNRGNLGFMKIEDRIIKVFPVTSKFRKADSATTVNNYELEFLIVEDGN